VKTSIKTGLFCSFDKAIASSKDPGLFAILIEKENIITNKIINFCMDLIYFKSLSNNNKKLCGMRKQQFN